MLKPESVALARLELRTAETVRSGYPISINDLRSDLSFRSEPTSLAPLLFSRIRNGKSELIPTSAINRDHGKQRLVMDNPWSEGIPLPRLVVENSEYRSFLVKIYETMISGYDKLTLKDLSADLAANNSNPEFAAMAMRHAKAGILERLTGVSFAVEGKRDARSIVLANQ